jgi:hypothetical protein
MRLRDDCGSSVFAVTTYILEDTLHIITLYTPIADGFLQPMTLKVIRRCSLKHLSNRHPIEGPAVPTSSLVSQASTTPRHGSRTHPRKSVTRRRSLPTQVESSKHFPSPLPAIAWWSNYHPTSSRLHTPARLKASRWLA